MNAEHPPSDCPTVAAGGGVSAMKGRSEIDRPLGSESRNRPLCEGQRVADLRPRLPALRRAGTRPLVTYAASRRESLPRASSATRVRTTPACGGIDRRADAAAS